MYYDKKRDLSNIVIIFSQLTTQIIEGEFALPTCMYEIRESRTGPFVKFAHIGDHVWHVWHCDLGKLIVKMFIFFLKLICSFIIRILLKFLKITNYFVTVKLTEKLQINEVR